MRSARRSPALAALALGTVAASVALAGCATVDDALGRVDRLYPDATAAAADWVTEVSWPTWLPSDAVDIRVRTVANETVGIVAYAGITGPIGSDCVQTERTTEPEVAAAWSVDAMGDLPDYVTECGDWSSMRTDDGWFAWHDG